MPLMMAKVRSAHGGADSPDPNVTEPTEVLEIPKSHGTRIVGIRGYLDFTTPPETLDIEFWVKNEHSAAGASTKWSKWGGLVGVANLIGFEHTGLVAVKVFMRLTNISGGTPVDVFAEMLTA